MPLRLGSRARTTDSSTVRALVSLADAARDRGEFAKAGSLYDEALRLRPGQFGAHVQAGHMFKEAGDSARAEAHYRQALAIAPDDPDLALQLGHFYKVTARPEQAEAAYRRALALKPGWADPRRELDAMASLGWVGDAPDAAVAAATNELQAAGALEALVPALAPRPAAQLLLSHGESLHIRRLGARERTFWGTLPVLRGVVAVRGFCLSEEPLVAVRITLNGLPIHHGPVQAVELTHERSNKRLRKFVFNVWLDMTRFARVPSDIVVRMVSVHGMPDDADGRRVHHERVLIADPLDPADFPGSDTLVATPGARSDLPLAEQINRQPSVVRPAVRAAFAEPPRNVLVLRTDQLGDVVASVPAMRRLREILPEARLVGLLTAANADLARTLDLFDEIIVVNFPDDPVQRARVMTLVDQEALRARLAPYAFDVALDLAPAVESRRLLLLSGARVLLGMGDHDWLTTSFTFQSRDRFNGADFMPHSGKALAMIEALGTMIRSRAEIVRRGDLARSMLEPYGFAAREDYVVLHTGARIAFSRWPGYDALARLILDRTDLRVLMLAEGPAVREALPADLAGSPRFQLLDQRLPFDHFDALISFATAFVGNDSGPKHLAALRGVPTVSVHSSRINWGEWGQEMSGSIVSRRVPCAGCLLYHHPEECGAGYACITRIEPEEVYGAVMALLQPGGQAVGASSGKGAGTEVARRPA